MFKTKFIYKIIILFMIFINLGLSVLVVFLMRHVQDLLNSDVRINLAEVVTQNKDAITSRLSMSLGELEIIASRINQAMNAENLEKHEDIQKFIAAFCREYGSVSQFIADADGVVMRSDGALLDIAGRKYFRLAIGGIPNISSKLVSRLTGDEVFVFSIPLFYRDEIVGTVHKTYTQSEMEKICSLSLFSARGYMYIVNSSGYTILHTKHDRCSHKTDNYFRDLFASGNPNASHQIQDDIQNRRNGFLETEIDGQKIFSAYTGIDKIHDWYLITSVPTDVVSANANTVIKLFFIVLFVIVFIFSSSITYFLWYKNKQRAHLEKIAFVDTVTDGDSYSKFTEDVTDILQLHPETTFHILKFDIKNFKYINNYYGFAFGDDLLRSIYAKINVQLTKIERVARIAGDNFVAFLEKADDKRLAALMDSLEAKDMSLYFTAGIYTVHDRTQSLNLMVDKASTAAQTLKGVLTRSIAYYSDEFEQKTMRNEQLKREVRQALTDNSFIPFYQPKVDINTKNIVGGEALVRWKVGENKFVSPGEFIPMCEETGLITEVDLLVYEQVLVFLQGRLQKGLPCVPISVNFSRLHLLNKDFFSLISGQLKQYNVPASLLEIEITESAIFDNMQRIYEFTIEAHSHGFMVAMDDFGAGYSSLHMLKDIPIDVLKIDKDFLAEAKDNKRRNIIFGTVVDMAKQLNIKIVVEGVEYIENVDLMRSCGCRVAQGYYFAKPMNEELFSGFIAEHTPGKSEKY